MLRKTVYGVVWLSDGPVASMRPQRNAAENLKFIVQPFPNVPGFNEAAA